jgi:uncharacterized protein involved in type VI secretion and phage assembly
MPTTVRAGNLVEIRASLSESYGLTVEEFSGAEAISEPFSFQFKLLADRPFPFAELLGQSATFVIAPLGTHHTSESRFINGIIAELRQAPPSIPRVSRGTGSIPTPGSWSRASGS